MSNLNSSKARRALAVCVTLALAGFSVVATGCSYEDQPAINRAITDDVRSVVISTDSASIGVRTHEGRRVEIEARANRGGTPTLTSTMKGGTLEINGGCNGGFLCGATIDIVLPVGVAVTADTDAGDISLSGNPGAVVVSTDAGDVEASLDTTVAAFSATTDAGDIDVRTPAGRYAVEADADSGDVAVEGIVQDDAAPAKITGRSDAGDVTIRGT